MQSAISWTNSFVLCSFLPLFHHRLLSLENTSEYEGNELKKVEEREDRSEGKEGERGGGDRIATSERIEHSSG